MNHLSVLVGIKTNSIPSSDDRPWIVFAVAIDGVTIPARFPEGTNIVVPLPALRASLVRDGEHFIFNCICGHPRDANLSEGVQVAHTATTVSWTARIPVPIAAVFDRAQYAAAIAAAQAEAARLAYEQPALAGHLPPELRMRRCWQVLDCASTDAARERFAALCAAFARRYDPLAVPDTRVAGEEQRLFRCRLESTRLLGEATVLVARDGPRVFTMTALDRAARLRVETLLRVGRAQLHRPTGSLFKPQRLDRR